MTYSVFLPKCDLFSIVSTISSLYFSVRSTTKRYFLHLNRLRHSSIHWSHVIFLSSSFHLSVSPYGGHVNRQSYSPADSNMSFFTTVQLLKPKALTIALDSSTCNSFISCPVYLLPHLAAASILPEKPENGSNISSISDK